MSFYRGFFGKGFHSLVTALLFLGVAQLTRADVEEEAASFWEEWNAYVTELIRNEMESPDPWESFNRKIFAFNDTADRYVLLPLTRAYRWVTPDPVERGIGNMFSNLREIRTVANDLLQFKFGQAASDTGRFVVNSTVGLLGFFDVASPLGLEKHAEDFGQTLGYWGVGTGPYLVVPVLGSYTLRDGIGAFPDNSVDYISNLDHVRTRNQLTALRVVDTRAELIKAEKLISGDRYTFIRDAYLQRREYLVKDGEVEDTFGDDESFDEWDEWEE